MFRPVVSINGIEIDDFIRMAGVLKPLGELLKIDKTPITNLLQTRYTRLSSGYAGQDRDTAHVELKRYDKNYVE